MTKLLGYRHKRTLQWKGAGAVKHTPVTPTTKPVLLWKSVANLLTSTSRPFLFTRQPFSNAAVPLECSQSGSMASVWTMMGEFTEVCFIVIPSRDVTASWKKPLRFPHNSTAAGIKPHPGKSLERENPWNPASEEWRTGWARGRSKKKNEWKKPVFIFVCVLFCAGMDGHLEQKLCFSKKMMNMSVK